MHENWGEVRKQLDDVLASERAHHQARGQQRAPFWHIIQAWWASSFGQQRRGSAVRLGLFAPKSPVAMNHERNQQ